MKGLWCRVLLLTLLGTLVWLGYGAILESPSLLSDDFILLGAGLILRFHSRAVAFASVWLLLTVVPVLNLLPVERDLQNSRHLYLPSVGFALLLAIALDGIGQTLSSRHREWASAGLSVVVGAAYTGALAIQTAPWVGASREASGVLAELKARDGRVSPGGLVQVEGVPDNVMGAYVFRNGLASAARRVLGARYEIEPVLWLRPGLRYRKTSRIYQAAFVRDPRVGRVRLTVVMRPDGGPAIGAGG